MALPRFLVELGDRVDHCELSLEASSLSHEVKLTCVSFVTLDQKNSHSLEDDEHASPPAAKRRRMGSGVEADDSIQSPLDANQNEPGRGIEEELTTALGENVVDTIEPTDNTLAGHDDTEASDPPATATAAATPQIGEPNINQDVSTLISDIMDHTERQEQTVSLGPQEIPPSGEFPGARGYAFLKANSHLKIQSLPILDNLVSLRPTPDRDSVMLIPTLVHANPLLPLEKQLSRSDCHDIRTGFRERSGVCHNAITV